MNGKALLEEAERQGVPKSEIQREWNVGMLLGKSDLEELLDLRDLEVVNQERQNVAKACETLSNSTAEAFGILCPEKVAHKNLIKSFNDFFDVMDSRKDEDENPLKCAFGTHLPEQVAALKSMKEKMVEARVWSKSKKQSQAFKINGNYLPFQRAIILMCNTIPKMFESLQKEYGITTMKMKRFNQDCLENHFSQIRGWCHQHPGPLGILQREKLIGLGAKAKSFHKASVRLEAEGGHLNLSAGSLTAEILNQIKLVGD